jgi:glycolate oxidase FAD binding subunit
LPSVSSVEEAAAYLREASAAGRTVRIGGDLDPTGLDRVLEHEAGDLTCTVEAGIRLSALNDRLAEAGQRLSLDPPGEPTIGACLAEALSGPRRHRFGTPRDLVLGVTLVLADGTVASAGGKVVKNVAGYDLGKLVCGSRGRLALIARVSLRLHPMPAAARTLVVETSDPASVVGELRRSQLVPSALDVLLPRRVAVLFEGGAAAVEAQLDRARSLVGGAEADEAVWEEARERQFAARGVLRFPPGDLRERLRDLDDGAVVRAGAGIAYAARAEPPERADVLAGLHGRIRKAFDPQGILAA